MKMDAGTALAKNVAGKKKATPAWQRFGHTLDPALVTAAKKAKKVSASGYIDMRWLDDVSLTGGDMSRAAWYAMAVQRDYA